MNAAAEAGSSSFWLLAIVAISFVIVVITGFISVQKPGWLKSFMKSHGAGSRSTAPKALGGPKRKPGETVWLIDHQDYLKDPSPPANDPE